MDRALERYREYLLVLARQNMPARLRGKIDPSDLVQQTMLEAHKTMGQFRGEGDAALAGWLRQILAHNLADAGRAFGRHKRDVALERSLEDSLAASSMRLGACLAAPHGSPRSALGHKQALWQMAAALAALPEAQRQAIELHHLEGLSLADTAARMDRTAAAVAGLLHRGLKAVRERLLADSREPGAGDVPGQ